MRYFVKNCCVRGNRSSRLTYPFVHAEEVDARDSLRAADVHHHLRCVAAVSKDPANIVAVVYITV